MADPIQPVSVDQAYAARQADNESILRGRALLQAHPELLQAIHPEAATSAPAGPTPGNQPPQPESAGSPAGAQPTEGLQPSGEYTGTDLLGNKYTLSKRQVGEAGGGSSLTGLDEATRAKYPHLAQIYDALPYIGLALGVGKVVSGGLAARAAETAAGGEASSAAAGAAEAAKPAPELGPSQNVIREELPEGNGFRLSYKAPDGKDVAEAIVRPNPETGKLEVTSMSSDTTRGILGAKASGEIGKELIALDAARPAGAMSPLSAQLLEHAKTRGLIPDAESGQPISSGAEAGGAAGAEAQGEAGAAPSAQLPAPVGPTAATPEGAAQSLAEKQLAALKTARVGEGVAEEYTGPELATRQSELDALLKQQKANPDPARFPQIQALRDRIDTLKSLPTTVSETLTQDESVALRQSLESYYAQGKEPPKLAAHVQAMSDVYKQEAQEIHALNLDLRARAFQGEDVSADLNELSNRFAAFAENSNTLAGQRSELARGLQNLNPNKPGNAFISGTARIAQELSPEGGPMQLSDLLARVQSDQIPRIARQAAEDVHLGRSLYNAFNEYYYSNLLSNAGRTSARIGTSNTVAGMMQLATRQVRELMPGSDAELGGALHSVKAVVDGLWRSADIGLESLKTGERLSQIEGGSIEADDPFGANATRAISAKAFGLGSTDPTTGDWESSGIGKGVDYLGSALRLPGRVITGVHQFQHAVAREMAGSWFAWDDAVAKAREEGLSGLEGYQRAGEIYKGTLNDMPAEMRLNASLEADKMTFVNKLEGLAADVQKVTQYPILKQLMPFFRIAYNVKKMGADYTPGIGELTNVPGLISGTDAGRSTALAKMGLGALMGVAISHEYHEGNLVLDKNGAPKIKIGDNLYSVPPPLDVPIGTIGNYMRYRDAMNDPDALAKAGAYSRALGEAFANDSIVQTMVNIKKFINDVQEGKPEALKQLVGQELSGLVPASSLLRAGALATDPLERNPNTVMGELATGIPGLSQNEPARVDLFNKPVPNPEMGFPDRMLYPVNITKVPTDRVSNELLRLGIRPGYAPSFLNGKETDQWNADRADGLYDDLADYVKSKDYKEDSDPYRKAMIDKMIAQHTHFANIGMLQDPKLANLIMDRKLTLKGLPSDVVIPGAEPIANEFGVTGSSTAVPATIPKQPELQ